MLGRSAVEICWACPVPIETFSQRKDLPFLQLAGHTRCILRFWVYLGTLDDVQNAVWCDCSQKVSSLENVRRVRATWRALQSSKQVWDENLRFWGFVYLWDVGSGWVGIDAWCNMESCHLWISIFYMPTLKALAHAVPTRHGNWVGRPGCDWPFPGKCSFYSWQENRIIITHAEHCCFHPLCHYFFWFSRIARDTGFSPLYLIFYFRRVGSGQLFIVSLFCLCTLASWFLVFENLWSQSDTGFFPACFPCIPQWTGSDRSLSMGSSDLLAIMGSFLLSCY